MTYIVTLGVSLVVGMLVWCGFYMYVVLTLMAARGPGGGPGAINLGNLPDEALVAGGVLAAAAYCVALAICYLMYRILARCQTGLAGATARATGSED